MKMTVRACALAAVLILLGAGSMFAQNAANVYSAGSPTQIVAGVTQVTNNYFNLAMNAEGYAELGAPVTICAGTAGGATTAGSGTTAAAGALVNAFNVGDVYNIEYKSSGGAPDPLFATTTLTANNIVLSSSAAGVGVIATVSAAQTLTGGAQPPGTVSATPLSIITITITGAPAAATGINCITIQNLRFNSAHTVTKVNTAGATYDAGLANGTVISATVTESVYNATTIAPTAPVIGLPATGFGLPGPTLLLPGFPLVGGTLTGTNLVGTVATTIGQNGLLNFANGTGVQLGTKSGIAGLTPTPIINGTTRNGVISVEENAVQATSAGTCAVQYAVPAACTPAVNAPIQAGGGLFRASPTGIPATDIPTWLVNSGATTGTQVTFTVFGMPAGSSVSFPATVSSASPGVNLQMAGGGTINAPGGSVTYTTTINEGTPYTLGGVGTQIGPSVDITYTVTPGSAAGSAFVTIALAPPPGSAVPNYAQVSFSGAPNQSVFPTTLVTPATFFTLFTVGTNQTTRVFPFVTFTGGTTPADFDTGLAITNTGRGVSVNNGAPCFTVPAGGTAPAGCNLIGPTPAAGTNVGQDGPFTVFFMSKNATVASIRSTAANFPNASSLTSGNLVQGQTYSALLSQLLSAAGVTGAFSGEVIVVNDFPNSNGFGFISQFTNPSGGATMGYKVTAIAGENTAQAAGSN